MPCWVDEKSDQTYTSLERLADAWEVCAGWANAVKWPEVDR